MPKKTYKLALMGAHAVGKTVFFGSYFYLTTQLGRGNHTVSVKTKHSVDVVGDIIRKLFEEHTVVEGTSERIDLSFDVAKLGMSVEFYDVPGGHTQDLSQWEERGILKDLQTANGVLFFISAEDVLYHREKLIEDNMVFGEAINLLRKNPDGKRWRQDVPIYFLFTKCDLIPPEVTLEDLEAGIPALINGAKSIGKRVVSWKVTSMGEWPSPNKPPEDYQPTNVLEPMESMFLEIKDSVARWSKKVAIVSTAFAIIGWSALSGSAWVFDWNRWNSTKLEIQENMELNRFDQAQVAMQAFYDRWKIPSIILPSFLSPGPDANAMREDLLKKYETQLYGRLQPYINVDVSSMPRGNSELFSTAADLVREYLSIPDFYQVNPANYENVRAVETYYEVGEIVLAEEGLPSGEEGEEEVFRRLQKQLELVSKVPVSWKEELTQKTDALLRVWVRNLPVSKASPEDMDGFISKIDLLSQHPFMPQELRAYLGSEKEDLTRQKVLLWKERVSGWINETNRQEPERAIKNLQDHQIMPGLPKELRPAIDQTLSRHYKRLVDVVLQQNPDAESMEKLIANFPDMPVEERGRLESRIQGYISQKLQELERRISSAKSIEELKKQIPTLLEAREKYPQGGPVLSKLFGDTASRILNQDVRSCSEKIRALVSRGDFGGAKNHAEQGFSDIVSQIRALGGELQGSSEFVDSVERNKSESLKAIEADEYDSCRDSFNSIRYSEDEGDIRRIVKKLKDFIARWPLSSKAAEVRKVQDFLERVQGGVKATLIVVGGDFTTAESWTDKPDMFIELHKGDTLLTKTDVVEDKVQPNFNFKYPMTWNIDTEITFVGIEEDPTFNDEIFRYTVRASGLFGYKRLTDTLENGGNKLYIKLVHSIPECPW